VGWKAEDLDDTLHHDARCLIYEATAGERGPRIYHPTPLNSIVLEREQVERLHIVARPYEIKT
jgi:hypothetical protein